MDTSPYDEYDEDVEDINLKSVKEDRESGKIQVDDTGVEDYVGDRYAKKTYEKPEEPVTEKSPQSRLSRFKDKAGKVVSETFTTKNAEKYSDKTFKTVDKGLDAFTKVGTTVVKGGARASTYKSKSTSTLRPDSFGGMSPMITGFGQNSPLNPGMFPTMGNMGPSPLTQLVLGGGGMQTSFGMTPPNMTGPQMQVWGAMKSVGMSPIAIAATTGISKARVPKIQMQIKRKLKGGR